MAGEQQGSGAPVQGDLDGSIKTMIADLNAAWRECKTLGVDFQHVIDAVERGTPLSVVMAVVRLAGVLPDGTAKGVQTALRMARALGIGG